MRNEYKTGWGFCDVLFIVFVVLKLTHVIDWSWWWVTAPMWIPLCIVFILLIIYAVWDAANKRK